MAKHCTHCEIDFTNPACPRCGRPASRPVEDVSEVSEKVDAMVAQASRPSLASLVKAGLKKGLIQVVPEYAQHRKNP